jgi:hypothetical protein
MSAVNNNVDNNSSSSAIDWKAESVHWQEDPALAFELGVELAFDGWEVLNLSILNGWAGGETQAKNLREEFIDNTIEWFLSNTGNNKLFQDEVSDYLYETLQQQFKVEAEDDSADWLAKLLCTLYTDCIEKKSFSGVFKMIENSNKLKEKLAASRENNKSGDREEEKQESSEEENSGADEEVNAAAIRVAEQVQRMNINSNNDNSINNTEEESAPQLVDEDGWTTIPSKGKGKNKKK